MPKLSDQEQLAQTLSTLENAACGADTWESVCDRLADFSGAVGTALIPMSLAKRVSAMPVSQSLLGLSDSYFRNGWYKRDYRERGTHLMLRRGYLTDQDLITRDGMRRNPYWQDHLAPNGFEWFAGVPFHANDDLWAAAIQRSPAQGPFQKNEIEKLLLLKDHLSLAARRAALLGFQKLDDLQNLLEETSRAVITLDFQGRVVGTSSLAGSLMGEALLVKEKRLKASAPQIDLVLGRLLDSSIAFDRLSPGKLAAPVLVPLDQNRAVSVDAVPTTPAFQNLLTGVSTIVTLRVVERHQHRDDMLRRTYNLTPTEARVALLLASGQSLKEIAEATGAARSTLRAHLRSIFDKTSTHRQGELVALLSRYHS